MAFLREAFNIKRGMK